MRIEAGTLDTGATNEDARALTVDEFDTVGGGATPKLYEAACKGTHLPEVVIELW
jgi:type VI protein secretion system component Hcp